MFSNLISCLSFKDESNENQTNRELLIETSSVPKWRLLHGEGHWRGLLRPLDIDLRCHLIHYGEMAQATNDAFNRDAHTEYAGRCRYSMDDFFAKVGLEGDNRPYKYRVTKFIYATSGVVGVIPVGLIVVPLSREGPHAAKETNWMGYVAVADDESAEAMGRRDVVVAWRGSVQALEWISDFMVNLVAAPEVIGRRPEEHQEMVHHGFHSVYTSDNPHSPLGKTSARQQVLEEIKRLVETYKEEEISITVTGHSLGAALATLNALDIVSNKLNLKPDSAAGAAPIPVTAILFGCPRVGSATFKRIFSEQGALRALRVRNAPDVVPTVAPLGYAEVGEEVKIDTRRSKYLKAPGSFKSWHNLEVYLHGVAGDRRGSWWRKGLFRLVVERDIALVNKTMENLKGEYGVPAAWWVEENKGMVQREDGSWVAAIRYEVDQEDDHDS